MLGAAYPPRIGPGFLPPPPLLVGFDFFFLIYFFCSPLGIREQEVFAAAVWGIGANRSRLILPLAARHAKNVFVFLPLCSALWGFLSSALKEWMAFTCAFAICFTHWACMQR